LVFTFFCIEFILFRQSGAHPPPFLAFFAQAFFFRLALPVLFFFNPLLSPLMPRVFLSSFRDMTAELDASFENALFDPAGIVLDLLPF